MFRKGILLMPRRRYTPPYGTALYLPLRELSVVGGNIISKDLFRRICPVAGAIWTPQGFYFDGVDDAINTGSDLIGTGNVSVMGWLYQTGWNASFPHRIMSNGKFKVSTAYMSGYTQQLSTYSDGGVGVLRSTVNAITLNTWIHFAVTRDSNSNGVIYINGEVSGSGATGTIAAGTTNIVIGNELDGTRAFKGKLDEILVFNRLLTQIEIREHRTATKWSH